MQDKGTGRKGTCACRTRRDHRGPTSRWRFRPSNAGLLDTLRGIKPERAQPYDAKPSKGRLGEVSLELRAGFRDLRVTGLGAPQTLPQGPDSLDA